MDANGLYKLILGTMDEAQYTLDLAFWYEEGRVLCNTSVLNRLLSMQIKIVNHCDF